MPINHKNCRIIHYHIFEITELNDEKLKLESQKLQAQPKQRKMFTPKISEIKSKLVKAMKDLDNIKKSLIEDRRAKYRDYNIVAENYYHNNFNGGNTDRLCREGVMVFPTLFCSSNTI